jgi:hypothetical protein
MGRMQTLCFNRHRGEMDSPGSALRLARTLLLAARTFLQESDLHVS